MIKKAFRHLRTKIFAGILVLLPIGITFLVLNFVFNTLDSILDPLIPNINISLFHRVFQLPGIDELGVVYGRVKTKALFNPHRGLPVNFNQKTQHPPIKGINATRAPVGSPLQKIIAQILPQEETTLRVSQKEPGNWKPMPV